MRTANVTLAALLAALVSTTSLVPARAADAILSGSIAAASGEKMGGVDGLGQGRRRDHHHHGLHRRERELLFPAAARGQISRVGAGADLRRPRSAQVDLAASKAQNFTLDPLKDYVRQLPGDVIIAALPEETEHDKKMKRLVRNNCTGCHTPSYTLQHRFDEAGWTAIIDLMKMVNVSGIYQGEKAKPNGLLDFNEKELAAYLARARGPGESAMKIHRCRRARPARPRASCSGNTTCRPTPTTAPVRSNDGHDWSLGTPSRIGSLVHDAWSDLDGNLWFTSNVPNRHVTVGRIDAKTGAVKFLKVAGAERARRQYPRHVPRQGREPVVQRQSGQAAASPSSIRRPRRSRSTCRRRACRRPAAP